MKYTAKKIARLLDTDYIGDSLRVARLNSGTTQEALADKAGVHKSTVISYEQGRHIKLELLVALFNALGYELYIAVVRK